MTFGRDGTLFAGSNREGKLYAVTLPVQGSSDAAKVCTIATQAPMQNLYHITYRP